jgi:hypothetical protein
MRGREGIVEEHGRDEAVAGETTAPTLLDEGACLARNEGRSYLVTQAGS